ncbi:hypothetical protein K040078D81_44140 [Blautia hominis]|uniref:Uncharacterized protein n=1 Tax=Blautia hominis TaxID=2025493 RepID=A0ABQ0BFR1_9FIRM
MPVTEKRYPDWVQAQRVRGTTVKKKGDTYYLYQRTSRRVPGKKYPQPVDTYIGIITPEGVIKSEKKKISLGGIEVREYGFSRAVWQLCPEGFKKPLGNDWEDVLSILIWKWSPETYLIKEGRVKAEQDFHYQFNAQAASLSRRIYKEHGVDIKELQILKSIYVLYFEKERVVSKISREQEQLLEKTGVELSMC